MARIAFILLCHKDPEAIISKARRLTAVGDFVSIHFDGRASRADYEKIRAGLRDDPSVTFAARRHRCGWGEWSLVAATLDALRAATASFPHATHFYMLSGDCMPIKTAEHVHRFLDGVDCDYIESFDFFESNWIKTGMREERLIYRHHFNERTQPRRFYASYWLQRRLKMKRAVPADIEVMIGSQWWCLRRETIEKVLAFCKERPDVMRFFSTTWIPDETFFQTVVRHVVPRKEIRSRTLTFLMFTDYGMPVTFHDDHFDMLLAQNYLFARKISPQAEALKLRLGILWRGKDRAFSISDNGRELYRFLVGQGRIGRRFAPRFWESEASLDADRTLLLVACKKWHIAKRLTAAIRSQTRIAAVDYLFNELQAGLPDLGGVETTIAKRERHRRALIRLLMDEFGSDKLVLCVDTSAIGLISDLLSDRAQTRLLLIETPLDDSYVHGHMQRIGLTGTNTPPGIVQRLTGTVRGELTHEIERLRDLGNLRIISAEQDVAENGRVLADFLGVEAELGQALAARPGLLND